MNTPSTQDPVIGASFSTRWCVERALCEGGMGSVYVARHTETGRRVALKLIKSDGAMNPGLVARFKRETAALAAVSHPNIVTFLDSGIDNGSLFLVMELLNGTSLRAVMTQPIAWQRAFRIASDVLRALAAVHAHGIVHRDLKPENIFLQASVGHDDFAKLIDFGIARSDEPTEPSDPSQTRASTSVHTQTGALIGTPGYMSPEVLSGFEARASADLYAVGVMLYELITGVFPFDAASVQAMLVRQLLEPVTPLSSLVDVPPGVEAIVMGLLERDPALRPPSAFEALALLSGALAAPKKTVVTQPPPQPAPTPAPAPAPAPPTRLRPSHSRTWARRKRVGVVAAGGAFAVGVVLTIVSFARDASADPPAVDAGVVAEPSPPPAPATDVTLEATPSPAASPTPRPAATTTATTTTRVKAKRPRPTAAALAAFVDSHRGELLACGGDRVPRAVALTFSPSGGVRGAFDQDVAACAGERVAAWKSTPFDGDAVTAMFRLAFGARKPALPSAN